MLLPTLVWMLARLGLQIARLKSPRSLCGKSWAHRNESFERFEHRSVIQIDSVTRQFRNRDHHQLVLLADHTGGMESRETGEINCGFRLAAALEDAAGPGAKRENVSRSREVVRTTAWISDRADCSRPIMGRNSGCNVGALHINRNREHRPAQRGVVWRHRGEVKLI